LKLPRQESLDNNTERTMTNKTPAALTPQQISKKEKALVDTFAKLSRQLEAALDSDDMSLVIQASVINVMMKGLSSKIDKEIYIAYVQDNIMERN